MIKLLRKFLLFDQHTCPWWLAYSWDNRFRTLFHNPDSFIKPFVQPGAKVADLGCGMGYFSIAMAAYTGDSGKVYATDIQAKMLDILQKRIKKYQYREVITPFLVKHENDHIPDMLDFILSFWMLHEVPDKASFLEFWLDSLSGNGKFLLVEPKFHVTRIQFDEEIALCMNNGLTILDYPEIRFSRSVIFEK